MTAVCCVRCVASCRKKVAANKMIGWSFSRIDLMLTHYCSTAQYCMEKLYLHIRKWLMHRIVQRHDVLFIAAIRSTAQFSHMMHFTVQQHHALNSTAKWCTEQYINIIHCTVKRHNALYNTLKLCTEQYILWNAALFSVLDRSKRQQMIDHKYLGKRWIIEHNTSCRVALCKVLFFLGKWKITN